MQRFASLADGIGVARRNRFLPPETVQHVIARVVGGEFFFDIAGARDRYLALLGRALEVHDARVFAFSLMSNHVHLALLARHASISRLVSSVHCGFALWLNRQLERIGSVFVDRFRNVTFDTEAAGTLVAYIHNNSTRAGVVTDPSSCTWSSHRAYTGVTDPQRWLAVDLGLDLAGFDSSPEGRREFATFVAARKHHPSDPTFTGDCELSEVEASRRRGATQTLSPSHTENAPPGIGPLAFPHQTPEFAPHGTAWDGNVMDAIASTAGMMGVPASDLRSSDRPRWLTTARDALFLAWSDQLRRTTRELAVRLGVSDSAAAHAIRRARRRPDARAVAQEIAAAVRLADRAAGCKGL